MAIVDPNYAVVIPTRSNREVLRLRCQGVEVDVRDTISGEWYRVYDAMGDDLQPLHVTRYDYTDQPGGMVVPIWTWDAMRYDRRVVCPTCNRRVDRPRMVVQAGRIVECCVDELHDGYVVPNTNHAAFVAKARKAGISGR